MFSSLKDRLDDPVNRDSLVVAGNFLGVVEVRDEPSVDDRSGESLSLLVSSPKFVWSREPIDHLFRAGEVVVLDDLGAVGGVGELEPRISAYSLAC